MNKNSNDARENGTRRILPSLWTIEGDYITKDVFKKIILKLGESCEAYGLSKLI